MNKQAPSSNKSLSSSSEKAKSKLGRRFSNGSERRGSSSTFIMKSEDEIQQEIRFRLGEGPMRFGPSYQTRTIQQEAEKLSEQHIEAFVALKARWHVEHSISTSSSSSDDSSRKSKAKAKRRFTDVQFLRFIQYTDYSQSRAMTLMTKTNARHFELNAFDLEHQLLTKTLFPVPGLKTIEPCSEVFYMRPSRFIPKRTPTSEIIDNLIYVMDHISSKQRYMPSPTTDGIAFIANMNDWTLANFSTDYCYKFLQCLQGRYFPAKVSMFLIVNPPKWFGKVWKVMKPMLTKDFRKKVFLIQEDSLWTYLQEGYEEYLPDEFLEGTVCTEKLASDFVKFRQTFERETRPELAKAMKKGTSGGLRRVSKTLNLLPSRKNASWTTEVNEPFDLSRASISRQSRVPKNMKAGRLSMAN